MTAEASPQPLIVNRIRGDAAAGYDIDAIQLVVTKPQALVIFVRQALEEKDRFTVMTAVDLNRPATTCQRRAGHAEPGARRRRAGSLPLPIAAVIGTDKSRVIAGSTNLILVRM